MRETLRTTAAALAARASYATRSTLRTLVSLQGVAGVACVATGSVLLWGIGVSLLIVGGFLLVGAWASR